MASMLFPALRGVCLLAGLATAGLWARSYFVADHYLWPVKPGTPAFALVDSRALFTAPGRLVFQERSALM